MESKRSGHKHIYTFHGTTRFATVITINYRHYVTVLSGVGTKWGRTNNRPSKATRKQAARMLADASRRGYKITRS